MYYLCDKDLRIHLAASNLEYSTDFERCLKSLSDWQNNRTLDEMELQGKQIIGCFLKGSYDSRLKIYPSHDDILFVFEMYLMGNKYTFKRRIENLPRSIIAEIKRKAAKFIVDTIPMRTEVVRAFSPEIFGKNMVINKQPATQGRITEIAQQRLLEHVELILDLLAYYKDHKNDLNRVSWTVPDDPTGIEYITLRIPHFKDFTSVNQKFYPKIKNELKEVQQKSFNLIYEHEKSFEKGQGKYGVKPQAKEWEHHSSFIIDFITPKKETDGNYIIHVHPFLLQIDKYVTFFPRDLRDRWAKWGGRIGWHHRKASAWSWNLSRMEGNISFEKLLEYFDIGEDAKDPKRFWTRFFSCVEWLKDTKEMIDLKYWRFFNNEKKNPETEITLTPKLISTEITKEDIESYKLIKYITFRADPTTHPWSTDLSIETESSRKAKRKIEMQGLLKNSQ